MGEIKLAVSGHIDPKLIKVNKPKRQRKDVGKIDDLMQSIANVGIINPIVVRNDTEEGTVELVAGERRLVAALKLGLASVPVSHLEDLDETTAKIIELEENMKRLNLTWQEQALAYGEIHKLYSSIHEGWKYEDSARQVAINRNTFYQAIQVYIALHSANASKIKDATSFEQAYNILVRMADRKAENIVQSIITTGSKIFGMGAKAPPVAAPPSPTAAPNVVPFSGAGAPEIASFSAEGPEGPEDPEAAKASSIESIFIPPEPKTPPPVVAQSESSPPTPVLNVNFIDWIKTYEGPKFNLIHCDFPYGVGKVNMLTGETATEFYSNEPEVYRLLLSALTEHLDRIMSYSAHMVFWFDMKFYTETFAALSKCGLFVHPHPLIWHKTNGGIVPGGQSLLYFGRSYETALLCTKGNRPLLKRAMNSYAAPVLTSKNHPSQKPEPMLRFFLSALVNETSTVLDPTCGSASALKAAEDLGAKSVLGLEINPVFADEANKYINSSRVIRHMQGRPG